MSKSNLIRKIFSLGLILAAVNVFADNLNFYGQNGIHKTQSARTLGHGRLGLGLFVEGWQNRNLIHNSGLLGCSAYDCGYSIQDYFSGNAYPFLAFGISNYFDFAVSIPIYGDWAKGKENSNSRDLNIEGWGDVGLATKFRIPLGNEGFPIDLAATLGFSMPSGRTDKYGPWVRDPLFLDIEEIGDTKAYTNGKFASKFGAAATFDFGKMDALPLLLHLNYGFRTNFVGDHPNIHNMAAAFELTPVQLLTFFGEFYTDILDEYPKTFEDKKLTFFDFSTATIGLSLHLSKKVDVQLGSQYLLGKKDKYIRNLELADKVPYNARIIPKFLAFGGITVQLLVVEPEKPKVEEPPTATFNSSPESVPAGEFVTLNWVTTNATEVSIDGIGIVPAQGSIKVKPEETTTYNLTAKGPGGTKIETAKVVVQALPLPTVIFKPSQDSIKRGEELTLNWTVTEATEVKIEGIEHLNVVPAQGSRKVSPTKTTSYTIIATGPGGTKTEMIEVIVEAVPVPIIIFTADADSVHRGQNVTLSWKVDDATHVNLEGVGPVQAQGTRKVKMNEPKTFVLTATNHSGTISATVDVGIETPPPIEKQVNLKGVNFLSGKAELTLDAKRVLDGVVEQLLASPEVNIEIQGHTDNKGNPKTNQTLSERRAKAVVSYLASKGVKLSRMRAVGFGADVPIADNSTEAGREINRRIEMIKVE